MREKGANAVPKTIQRFENRQSMKKRTFEIFHYRDPRMETVALHHHDFYEVYFFLGGSVEYRVESSAYRLMAGDLLFINPREFHQPLVGADMPYERIVLWISPPYLDSLSTDEVRLSACFERPVAGRGNLYRPTAGQRAALEARFTELLRQSAVKTPDGGMYAATVFTLLMLDLNRLFQQKAKQVAPMNDPSPLISAVLAYIGTHSREEMTLDDLASRFFVSKFYLSHEFRRRVGVSIYRYILQKRLFAARQMLFAGCPAGQACRDCGFRDYANFYRAFTSEYGIGPAALRRTRGETT